MPSHLMVRTCGFCCGSAAARWPTSSWERAGSRGRWPTAAVDEIWYILAGQGQMWRRQAERQETVPLRPGTCVSIPAGTHFQFRTDGDGPLAAVGVTMPPWPGDDEAYEVPGEWPADAPGVPR